jgi:single-stranded-DNA-specific exonuclease
MDSPDTLGREANIRYSSPKRVTKTRTPTMAIPAVRREILEATNRVHRRIRVREQHLSEAAKIVAATGVHPVVARILAARGFSPGKELQNYLKPTLKEGLPTPEELKNLSVACDLISACHSGGKAIAICCDFDVDGLSGGSVVHSFFNTAGISSKVFVPDRFTDGYGLNERVVREIAAAGYGLLLTIDFGTTNVKELTVAKELGLKTIVVDHHHTGGKVPPADVFVNPHQDGCGFAGKIPCAAGLAWYLVLGLRRALDLQHIDPKEFLDLACLGTICDMVPLVGVNRIIAKRGLELLTMTKRPGLKAIKNSIGIQRAVECSDVSFGIGPRLNAAGRLVHGEVVVELLTTSDSIKAEKVAKQLNDLNAERQEIENSVKQEAISMVECAGGPGAGIVVWSSDFHTGVIGIVAQRLVETYYRPSVVMGMDSEGVFKGSVRGIKNFSVVDTLAACGHVLLKFGGHEGAGGFSVKAENLEVFRAVFIAECEKRLAQIETTPFADADTEVNLKEISIELVNQLKGLAPFGTGNPAPTVLLRKMRVVEVRDIKGAHLKAVLSDGSRFITAIMWRQAYHPALVINQYVDVVFRPEVSTWGGSSELQANLQAIEEASPR